MHEFNKTATKLKLHLKNTVLAQLYKFKTFRIKFKNFKKLKKIKGGKNS